MQDDRSSKDVYRSLPDYSSKRLRRVNSNMLERFAIAVFCLASIGVIAYVMISDELSRKNQHDKRVKSQLIERTKPAQFANGLRFLVEEDTGAAVASFTLALAEDKNCVDAYVGRGIAYTRFGDFAKAELDFLAAYRLNQKCSAIYMNLAHIRDLQSDFKGAVENYTNAIELDQNLLSAYGNRARCYFLNGAYSEALDDLSHVIRLDNRNEVAYLNRAITLARLSRFETAITNLSHPVLQDAATLEARKLAALLQVQSGNALDGLRTCKMGLDQNPQDLDFQLMSMAAMKQLANSETELSLEAKQALETATEELEIDYDSLIASKRELVSLTIAFQEKGCCSRNFMLLSDGVTSKMPTSKDIAIKHWLQAMDYLKVGDLETAVACFRESLRNNPNDREVSFKLAMTLLDQGRYELAANELQSVLVQSPDDKRVLTLLSMLYSRLENFRDSVKVLDRAISLDSLDPELYLLRANVLSLEGVEHKQVVNDCERTERLGLKSATLFILKANALMQLGEVDNAIAPYSAAIELDPKSVEGWLNRSIAYRRSGKLELALADARKVANIDGKSIEAHYEMSQCLAGLDSLEKALESIETALVIAPTDDKLHIQKGRVLMKMDRRADAVEAFAKADSGLLLKEDHFNISKYHFEMQNFEKAWLNSSKVLEMGEQDAEVLILAGQIAFSRDDWLKAESLLTRAVELNGGSAKVYFLLGKCASKRRDFKNALKFFRDSLRLDASSADTWLASGDAFERDGNLEQAVLFYSKVLEIDSSNHAGRLARARASVSLKKYSNALDDLKWLLSNGSSDETVSKMVALCRSKLASR